MERSREKTYSEKWPQWGVYYYRNTCFYFIQDEVNGAGCQDTPFELAPWPAGSKENDLSVNRDDFPAATILRQEHEKFRDSLG